MEIVSDLKEFSVNIYGFLTILKYFYSLHLSYLHTK